MSAFGTKQTFRGISSGKFSPKLGKGKRSRYYIDGRGVSSRLGISVIR